MGFTAIFFVESGGEALKYIYSVSHSHLTDESIAAYDTKQIGFFSSRKKAQEIVEQYRHILGFKDYPDNFCIRKIKINDEDLDLEEGE